MKSVQTVTDMRRRELKNGERDVLLGLLAMEPCRIGGNQVMAVFLPAAMLRQNRSLDIFWLTHGLNPEKGVMPRILIAEDRATMRNTLRSLFTLYSKWDVCGEARDGRQAVDAAIALKPDLVLLDYKMPNADGIEAAMELKEKLPNTPVVLFTLYKTAELESQARQVGVRAVIAKEEGVIKLLRMIEEELGSPLL